MAENLDVMATEISSLIPVLGDATRMISDLGRTIGSAFERTKSDGERLAETFKAIGSENRELAKVKPETAKEMGKAFGQMKGAGGAASGLLSIITSFIDFGQVLEPIAMLFEPINALLGIFSAQLSSELAPIMQELFEVFMDPDMIAFVKELAHIFVEMLKPAIEIGVQLLEMMMPLLPAIGKFIELLIVPGMEFLLAIFEALEPAMPAITKGLEAIGDALEWLLDGALTYVYEGIKYIGYGIQWFVAGVVNVINGIVQFFDFLDVVPDFSVPMPSLANEGIALSPTIAMIGDRPQSGGEAVIGVDRLEAMMGNNRAMVEGIERVEAAIERNNELQTRRRTWG